MKQVFETDLPGIGKKYTIETPQEERFVLVAHRTGRRELFRFRPEDETPDICLEMDEDTARKMGTLLAGTYFETAPEERTSLVMKEMSIEWLELPEPSTYDGKTIGDLEIRRRTGASLVAVVRKDRVMPSPGPDQELRSCDRLMAIGTAEQVRALVAYLCEGKACTLNLDTSH